MYKSLYNIISLMSGSVLAVGLDDKLVDKIDKNINIKECDNLCYIKLNKSNNQSNEKVKQISIKKLRKFYKKKSINYIICNYEHISKFLNTLVYDSIYIGNTKIYFYGNVDKNLIMKKYQRYNTKIEIKDYKDACIVEIDITSAKINLFKDRIYRIIDGFNNFVEIVGDILMG